MKTICQTLLTLFVGSATFFHVAHAEEARLSLAFESEIKSLDPRFTTDANSEYVENLVHCSLITFDANGKPVPELAAEAPKWTNPTTLQVKIKPNIKFSSGAALTIDDVKATYDSLLSTSGQTLPKSGAFSQVASVKTQGTDTLIITLKAPDATLVSNLVIGILPKAQASGTQIIDLTAFNGCGPFKVAKSSINELQLVPNTNYTLGTPVKLKELNILVVKDENTRFMKLRKGELDLVQNSLNRDLIGTITKYPNLQVDKRAGLKTTYLGFNMKDKLMGNPAIRKAIGMAIDRKVLIDHILAGLAVPATTMLPPTDPYFAKNLPTTTFDPKAAAKILDDAGFKPAADGTRFAVSFKTTTDVTRVTIARAIATQLSKIGIKVNVESMEWGRFKTDVEQGRVQMWTLQWIGFKDPDIFRFAFGSDSFPPNGGNRGFYSNPKLDTLLKQGKETTDDAKRQTIYQDIQSLIAQDNPYVFLWHEENFVVMQKSVKDFQIFADGRFTSLRNTYKQ